MNTLSKILQSQLCKIVATEQNQSIATGLQGKTFTPPEGYHTTILLSAYPRTTANITIQGITVDSNIARFYNASGSTWTGACGAYWLCIGEMEI